MNVFELIEREPYRSIINQLLEMKLNYFHGKIYKDLDYYSS